MQYLQSRDTYTHIYILIPRSGSLKCSSTLLRHFQRFPSPKPDERKLLQRCRNDRRLSFASSFVSRNLQCSTLRETTRSSHFHRLLSLPTEKLAVTPRKLEKKRKENTRKEGKKIFTGKSVRIILCTPAAQFLVGQETRQENASIKGRVASCLVSSRLVASCRVASSQGDSKKQPPSIDSYPLPRVARSNFGSL